MINITCILCISVESAYLISNLTQIRLMRVMQVKVCQKTKLINKYILIILKQFKPLKLGEYYYYLNVTLYNSEIIFSCDF